MDRPPSDARVSASVEAEAAAEQQDQDDDDEQEFHWDLLSSTACSSVPDRTRMETPSSAGWPQAGSSSTELTASTGCQTFVAQVVGRPVRLRAWEPPTSDLFLEVEAS